MAPDLTGLAIGGVRTLRAFGQRIPGAGGILAQSLEDSVKGKNVLITGASSGIGRSTALKLGEAGGTVLLVARTREKLEEVAGEVVEPAASPMCTRATSRIPMTSTGWRRRCCEAHGHVDILVNNAGKSIRRSVNRSYDRFHDYQRTMQLNYFAPVKLILDLLPGMRERGTGHIINISTMGLQVNTPRFAAYLASKAALDAFSRSIGPEIIGDGVHVTTVYMPLVRTPMIAPTKIYDRFPTLSPEEAADMIVEAIRKRPKRVTTTLGSLGQLTYAIAPGAQDLVVNRAYQLFPEGARSRRSPKSPTGAPRPSGARSPRPRAACTGSRPSPAASRLPQRAPRAAHRRPRQPSSAANPAAPMLPPDTTTPTRCPGKRPRPPAAPPARTRRWARPPASSARTGPASPRRSARR